MQCDEFSVCLHISHPTQALFPPPASTADALRYSAEISDTAGWEVLAHDVKIC